MRKPENETRKERKTKQSQKERKKKEKQFKKKKENCVAVVRLSLFFVGYIYVKCVSLI